MWVLGSQTLVNNFLLSLHSVWKIEQCPHITCIAIDIAVLLVVADGVCGIGSCCSGGGIGMKQHDGHAEQRKWRLSVLSTWLQK
jgi:hypothetical protein